jgi:hypothetical protein
VNTTKTAFSGAQPPVGPSNATSTPTVAARRPVPTARSQSSHDSHISTALEIQCHHREVDDSWANLADEAHASVKGYVRTYDW